MINAQEILKRADAAESRRTPMHSHWRECADYFRPIKEGIGTEPKEQVDGPDTSRLASLFDSAGIDAARTFASGMTSWLTPAEQRWAKFGPPRNLEEDDAAKKWYGICTEITFEFLANSEFYSEIIQSNRNEGVFGTYGMVIEEDLLEGPKYRALEIGKFSILENSKRRVDTVFFDYEFTAAQAVEKFGAEKLSKELLVHFERGGAEQDKKWEFLHAVMPNPDRMPGVITAEGQPFLSVWIDKKAKTIVQEKGEWELPIPVGRHDRMVDSPWGWAPAWQALCDMRQLNYMNASIDTLVELIADPPVLVPVDLEGDVDRRPGGATYFSDPTKKPETWGSQGDPRFAADRINYRREAVSKAFHVDLFNIMSSIPPGTEPTATEINARMRERLILFSPTFGNKNIELISPLMLRTFAVLLRAGAFPPAPANVVQQTEDGLAFIPDPKIQYTSRLALQIQAIENDSINRTMATIGPMLEMFPDMADHYDTDAMAREIGRNEGISEEFLRPKEQVEQLREQRRQEIEAERQRQAMIEEAGAVSQMAGAGLVAGEA